MFSSFLFLLYNPQDDGKFGEVQEVSGIGALQKRAAISS